MKQREALHKFDFSYPDTSMYGTYLVDVEILEFSLSDQSAEIRFQDSVTSEWCKKTIPFSEMYFTAEKVVDSITEQTEEKTYTLDQLPRE